MSSKMNQILIIEPPNELAFHGKYRFRIGTLCYQVRAYVLQLLQSRLFLYPTSVLFLLYWQIIYSFMVPYPVLNRRQVTVFCGGMAICRFQIIAQIYQHYLYRYYLLFSYGLLDCFILFNCFFKTQLHLYRYRYGILQLPVSVYYEMPYPRKTLFVAISVVDLVRSRNFVLDPSS